MTDKNKQFMWPEYTAKEEKVAEKAYLCALEEGLGTLAAERRAEEALEVYWDEQEDEEDSEDD